jgi:hypothetical protein
MTNSEIADAWAEHYPRRHDRQVSRQVCNLISELVRAKSSFDSSDNKPAFRVIVVLDTIGIPQEQFDTLNGEDIAGR